MLTDISRLLLLGLREKIESELARRRRPRGWAGPLGVLGPPRAGEPDREGLLTTLDEVNRRLAQDARQCCAATVISDPREVLMIRSAGGACRYTG